MEGDLVLSGAPKLGGPRRKLEMVSRDSQVLQEYSYSEWLEVPCAIGAWH